jgi:isopenicillin N synthase-like dioxygenase
MNSEEVAVDASPPAGPPPLLTQDQLLQLAQQGWLALTLPDEFATSISNLFDKSTSFFDLDDAEKQTLFPTKLGTEFGFYHVPNEKEYITYRCRIHGATSITNGESHTSTQAQQLEDSVAEAWQHCGLLLYRILCDLARWSDLDVSVWNNILDGTLSLPESEDKMSYTLMRVFQYLAWTGCAEKHSDLGLLTLCVGNGRGLEVLDRVQSTKQTHVWISPEARPSHVTILTGSTLRALSNNAFNTGVHRVVSNPQGRNSIVFALRHTARHDIDFRPFGGDGVVSPAELWDFVKADRVNINSLKELRERQREKLATGKSFETNTSHLPVGHGQSF